MMPQLLLLLSLGSSPPVMALPVVVPVAAAPRVLAEGDQSIGRGLRNMAVGGGVMAAGFGIILLSGAVAVTGIVLGVGAGFLVGGAGSAPVIGGAIAIGLLIFVAGFLTLIMGGIWAGVNGLQVLMRLSPDYKPGPASEYLSM